MCPGELFTKGGSHAQISARFGIAANQNHKGRALMAAPKPARRIEARLTHALLGVAAGSFVLGAAVTVVDVAARGLASANVPGAIEITTFLIGFGALVSMPVCYAQRNHVTAKLLSEISPNRFARPLGRFGAAGSVVFAAMLLWMLGENTLDKIGSPETTRDLGLPMPALLWIVSGTLALALIGALAGLWHAYAGGRRNV